MTLDVEELRRAVEERIGVPPDEVTEALLREAKLQPRVFLLPENFNERASYIADVLVQMLGVGSPVKGDLRFLSGHLVQALSYLVNSQSWRDGKLHDFDAREIQRKLAVVVRHRDSSGDVNGGPTVHGQD